MIQSAFIERFLPEYRIRHLFTTKLRFVAFAGFWVIYLYFLRDVLGQTKAISAVVCASFIVTSLAYFNVMRGRILIFSFALEILSDLTSITAVIYLTGGPYSAYYTIYLFYVFVAGILYNHYLAAVVAIISAAYFSVFLILCNLGVIPPLILDWGDKIPVPTYTPFAHFVFAVIFLAGIVYTVKVANYFSQQRERILEKRNRELLALHKMSSTIRSATALREVIEQILGGILEGLNFKAAVLLIFDRTAGRATLYAPGRMTKLAEIENSIGRKIDGMTIPFDSLPHYITREIEDHRIIFRKDLRELAAGLQNFISEENCDEIQRILGVKRIVVVPIVAGETALGALIGLSSESFVEEDRVNTFESFANQSALSLESAAMIDRLRRLNLRLEEANRVKSEFLATMSHELRTPLTAIIGFSELLMEGVLGDMSEEQKESLNEVLHNAADLLELINSLLDLTKIESGKMGLELRQFDISEVARRVSGTISLLVQKKAQNLCVYVQEKIPPVRGDERKIQQTLLNLVANANKFTPESGRIDVSIRYFSSLGEIEEKAAWSKRVGNLSHLFKKGAIEIEVEDNGVGIRPQDLDRVFEMFHQVDGSATRNFGGTGVGLALARKFIEMHGGLIWAESEPGKGAKFTAVIPMYPAGDSKRNCSIS